MSARDTETKDEQRPERRVWPLSDERFAAAEYHSLVQKQLELLHNLPLLTARALQAEDRNDFYGRSGCTTRDAAGEQFGALAALGQWVSEGSVGASAKVTCQHTSVSVCGEDVRSVLLREISKRQRACMWCSNSCEEVGGESQKGRFAHLVSDFLPNKWLTSPHVWEMLVSHPFPSSQSPTESVEVSVAETSSDISQPLE
ncbi:unnamed protein product [Trypanosoma congolense IL3000]|uniref:WGS project CAEQ00000000 data, annotated contig 2438 n=1 Tax=Trypanosoma congolense (strain IL3000) TaxID=1068625 RepID=F9WE45_TRYCI|nr:unnamed protein product [Trypanosoma congolense IL3000]